MKKLSFLFAALAIVFAVSSAFTSKKAVTSYDPQDLWFYVNPAQTTTQFADGFDDIASYDDAGVAEFNSAICDLTEPGLVCAVQILDDGDATLESAEVPTSYPSSEKIVYKTEE